MSVNGIITFNFETIDELLGLSRIKVLWSFDVLALHSWFSLFFKGGINCRLSRNDGVVLED